MRLPATTQPRAGGLALEGTQSHLRHWGCHLKALEMPPASGPGATAHPSGHSWFGWHLMSPALGLQWENIQQPRSAEHRDSLRTQNSSISLSSSSLAKTCSPHTFLCCFPAFERTEAPRPPSAKDLHGNYLLHPIPHWPQVES